MSEDNDFAVLTHSIKLNQDSLTVRANDGAGLATGLKEAAEVAGDLAVAGTAIRNAFGLSAAMAEPKTAPASSAPAQKKTYTRTQKPGPRPQKAMAVQSDEVCEHGDAYNDCNGKTTKAGNLYKNRFYSTCNQGCEAFGEQE